MIYLDLITSKKYYEELQDGTYIKRLWSTELVNKKYYLGLWSIHYKKAFTKKLTSSLSSKKVFQISIKHLRGLSIFARLICKRSKTLIILGNNGTD